jgi:AcrR family transcriptional regulator
MDPDALLGRVADVALIRLRAGGFAEATLAEIAAAAGVPAADLEAAVGDKVGLVAAVVAPLLVLLGDVLAAARAIDLRRPDRLRSVLGQYLDALLVHRRVAAVILDDPTEGSCEAIGAARRAIGEVADELARGTGGGIEHRIRAASATGALHAALLESVSVDPAAVRDVSVEAAVAILLG